MLILAKSELWKECISKHYLSRNYDFLNMALEKYLHLNFSEVSLVGLKTLAQLQALDSVRYLRQTLLKFRKATLDHPMVEILTPWICRFTTAAPKDLCIFFFDNFQIQI
jgi:hypothetical protein